MSIDTFFHRKYDRKTYNCAHFVSEVWKHLTKEDIAHKLIGVTQCSTERHITFDLMRQFVKLTTPETPCIVVMQRRHSTPHVGIFLRGRILHIHESGVEFQPLDVASRGFERMGFYK